MRYMLSAASLAMFPFCVNLVLLPRFKRELYCEMAFVSRCDKRQRNEETYIFITCCVFKRKIVIHHLLTLVFQRLTSARGL